METKNDTPQTMDMTQGNPLRLIFLFMLPILLGNVFQQMYNMADSIIVGRILGSDALATVGACGPIQFMFIGLSSGLSAGAGIALSQYRGAGDKNSIHVTVFNTMILMLGFSALIAILGFVTAPGLLRLFGMPEALVDSALVYMRTIFIGSIGMAMYNCFAETLRAFGDSKTPLYFLILSSIVNVVLDLLFVAVFLMGTFGAALATILSQLLSALLCYFYASRKYEYFSIDWRRQKLNFGNMKKIVQLGFPLAIQNMTIGLSSAVLQGFVNSFGESIIAANTVVLRFDNLENMPYYSFGVALSVYTAQNMGAGKKDRVYRGYRIALCSAVLYSLAVGIIGWLGGKAFVHLFITDPEIIAYGATGIRILSSGVIALGMIYIHRMIITGAGDTVFSMLSGMIEIVGRIGFAVLFINVLEIGYTGLWFTAIANWCLTGLFCFLRFVSGKWQAKGIVSHT